MKKLKEFDKYEYYSNAVQSPDHDAEFLAQTYEEMNKKAPRILREDFCAAFALCCEWVKLDGQKEAIGVDIDPEPIGYGKNNYLPQLTPAQQKRVTIREQNVLKGSLPQADIIAALNFSYFCLKNRRDLKAYLQGCRDSLNPKGFMIMDCFGGPECHSPNEHETTYPTFSYYWDQDSYNPITHEAMYYIHFKRPGEKKREKVFTYDWRMWSIAELRDLCAEVGFKKTTVYWEGTDRNGEGNGIFKPSEQGEICDAWVAYVIASI